MKKIIFTFLMLAYCSIVFGEGFEVITTGIQNGTVTAEPSTGLAQGADVTLTVTPDQGYYLSDIKAYRNSTVQRAQGRTRADITAGEEITLTQSTTNPKTYTFKMPNDNALIVATFEALIAYAVYDEQTTTLTFKYGPAPTGVTYYNALIKGWDQNQENLETNVTKVVFDESFADARPTSCYGWFQNFTALTTIEGMEYLNTSEASDMSYMFYGCTSLSSLTIGNGFTVTENIATDHIFITTADNFSVYPLSEGTLTIKGNPTIEKDIFGNVFFYGTLLSENALTVGKNDNGEISWKGGGFVKYNNYYLVKPDYGFVTKDGNDNEVYMAQPGATITISIQSGFEEMNMIPKAIHYNSGSEVIEKVTLTKNGDVWTFTMPEFPVQISQAIFTAAIGWSQDQKTLTIFGADTDDVPMQGQMVTNPMSYMMYMNGQMGMAQNLEIGQLFEALHNNVETVVFDAETLSSIEGTLTGQRLLYGFNKLTTITGFENLNMQNFYNTTEMFAGCSSLASLTIGSNFIVKAAQYENKWGEQENFDITDMFAGCTALATGTITVTGVPTIEQDIFSDVITEGTLLTDPENLLGDAVTEETDYFLWKGGHFKKFNDQEKVSAETITFTQGLEWSTYCTDKDLLIPDDTQGVEAFYVSAVNVTGQTGTITIESAGKKIYQNMPMLIHRTIQSALQLTEIAATIATHTGDIPTNAPQYVGTVLGQELASANNTIFVLRDGKFIAAPSVGSMAAHRCWIDLTITDQQNQQNLQEQQSEMNPVQNGARSLSITYGDGTTGINNHGITEFGEQGAKEGWFSLDGRKMDSKPTGKGFYISNGKKVLVK